MTLIGWKYQRLPSFLKTKVRASSSSIALKERAYDISPTASSLPTGFGNGKEVTFHPFPYLHSLAMQCFSLVPFGELHPNPYPHYAGTSSSLRSSDYVPENVFLSFSSNWQEPSVDFILSKDRLFGKDRILVISIVRSWYISMQCT